MQLLLALFLLTLVSVLGTVLRTQTVLTLLQTEDSVESERSLPSSKL
ncbi:MAG: hypothetical protein QM758_23580 [Armatimonas sp.]